MATKVFGMWNFYFSFSLFVCVCATHVWVFLVSKAYFVLFSFYHSLWENWVCSTHCWLFPQHLLPSLLPSRALFPFGNLGFQGCWLEAHFNILSFLCRKGSDGSLSYTDEKTKVFPLGARLDAVWHRYPIFIPHSFPPLLCSFTWPLSLL